MIFSVVDWLTDVVTSITHVQAHQGTRMPFFAQTVTTTKRKKYRESLRFLCLCPPLTPAT